LLGSLHNWVPQGRMLARHFQVFILDLRNHGHSPHAEEFNYEVMVGDLREFLDDQRLTAVHLLGHSMGGKAAMRFAQLHPDSVQKLVVVDISPREQPARYHRVLEAMHDLDLGALRHRAEVGAALVVAAPDKHIRQFLLKNIGRDKIGHLRWKPNLPSLRKHYGLVRGALPVTPVFPGPTLFVRGETSDYIRDQDLELIQRLFPRATVETIRDTGHWVHAEAPEEFLQIVTQFLLGKR